MSIPFLKVKGTSYEMGVAQGRAFRDQIHELSKERLRLSMLEMELAGESPDETLCLTTAEAMLPIQKSWNAGVHEEFIGISDGAGIDPARLLIGNGYTDFKDVVVRKASGDITECTSLFVLPESTGTDRGFAAQTWDMHASAQPFIVIIEREPIDGPRTLSLTTTGCLSLIGVNESGIAIGNNNLTPEDAKYGVIYLAMIHAALQATDFKTAVDCIVNAPRASGHHYYIMDNLGQAIGIETTATKHTVFEADEGLYVHSNHYKDASLAPAVPVNGNSLGREEIGRQLLKKNKGRLGAEQLKRILENRDELPNCICRYGDEPIEDLDPRRALARTCAAAILDPAGRGMWAIWGPPDQGVWEWYELT